LSASRHGCICRLTCMRAPEDARVVAQHFVRGMGTCTTSGGLSLCRLHSTASRRPRLRRPVAVVVSRSSPSFGHRGRSSSCWRSLVVPAARLVVGGVVVVVAQDVPFLGCRCPLRFWGLAKASAFLRADVGDACGRRSPFEASSLCLFLNPLRLIFLGPFGPLGRLVPAVDPDSRVSSLRHRRVWWWCS
jgi:hypothetical protein